MQKFNEIIKSNQPVLVDFYTPWCGPCKTLSPILKEAATRLHEKARIIKVDIDKNPIAALRYGIRSVPTMLIFKNGEIKWRHSGVVEANRLVEVLMGIE